MVWLCTVCGGKNNNSSTKCRIYKCHAPKPVVINRDERNHVRDYCPNCQHHEDFNRVGKNVWSCSRCHKKCKMTGKPVPEINEVVTNE